MKILIVDDSAAQRLALSALLRNAGYPDVLRAAGAQAALELLRAEPVDLILMDIEMPEIGGIEACGLIAASPALRDIPIIMVTSSSEASDLQAAFAAGAVDYITKPPNEVELLARVRSALRLKSEMDRRKARERELVTLAEQLQHTNGELRRVMQELSEQHELLGAEQERSERLLLNILPAPIAHRLKIGDGIIADSFPDVTVLFADLVDFTALAARIPPGELVAILNDVFSNFDRLAEQHGLEKIKTIGDAYMAVGGLPVPRRDHAQAVAEMALDMRNGLNGFRRATGSLLNVRIGIHTGPVVAGVIGTKKMIYDLWGDTVNLASRMESQGQAGLIQVTPETYGRLRSGYLFQERGKLNVRGRGELLTYWLIGRQG